MSPTVSVCVPTYNGAAYLAACLDSVLTQTFSDFEILVVDDCSSDESLDIAKGYARRDSRIRVSRNSANLGLVGNWNRCVELSQGEWIKFVFQDDVILPACLSRMLATSASSPAAIVSCGRDFIFESTTSAEEKEAHLENRTRIETLYRNSPHRSAPQCSETALQWIGRNLFGEPTAILLHRSVFEKFGWFNPRLYMICDLEYWIRVASNTGAAHVPERLARFRVHPDSSSSRYRKVPSLQYRIELIDPLLLVHDFAFHPVYANLRTVASKCRPVINLVDEFWTRALNALWFAKQAAEDQANPDLSLLDEWGRALDACPRLSTVPLRARLSSKWRALMKSARPWVLRRRKGPP